MASTCTSEHYHGGLWGGLVGPATVIHAGSTNDNTAERMCQNQSGTCHSMGRGVAMETCVGFSRKRTNCCQRREASWLKFYPGDISASQIRILPMVADLLLVGCPTSMGQTGQSSSMEFCTTGVNQGSLTIESPSTAFQK